MNAVPPPMPATANPCDAAFDEVFAAWRREGAPLIEAQRQEFEALLDSAESLLLARRLPEAIAAAHLAAQHAGAWHPGLFVSLRLERLIARIGAAALPHPDAAARCPVSTSGGMRVLHIATRAASVGGGVRMMWRWISRDGVNRHSVALTRQTDAIPRPLTEAVARSGGRISSVNRAIGGPVVWARRLQRLIEVADLIVLHAESVDIVPFLALAGLEHRPPVLMVDHSDHVFWIGSSFVDLVINTRRSGQQLAISRRHVAPDRTVLMPLCLEPPADRAPRAEAKRILGLPATSVVALCIARQVKFRPVGERNFPDALAPVLTRNPDLHLIAIGPGDSVDWSLVEGQAPGRVIRFPERPDTRTFLDAADIYIDSFPFPSITSLFEAGLSGLPLVTRFLFPDGCEVIGADSVGLDGLLVRAASEAGFAAEIERLVRDPDLRRDLGSRTEAGIRAVNIGANWDTALAELYRAAATIPRHTMDPTISDEPRQDDLDLFSPFVFGAPFGRTGRQARMATTHEAGLKLMPPGIRLRTWADLKRHDAFVFRRSATWRYLVPEWITATLRPSVTRS